MSTNWRTYVSITNKGLSRVNLFKTLNARRKLFSFRSDDDDDDDDEDEVVLVAIEGFLDGSIADLRQYLRRR